VETIFFDPHCIPTSKYKKLSSRDAFRGQSRSPNMVPFQTLGMVSY